MPILQKRKLMLICYLSEVTLLQTGSSRILSKLIIFLNLLFYIYVKNILWQPLGVYHSTQFLFNNKTLDF